MENGTLNILPRLEAYLPAPLAVVTVSVLTDIFGFPLPPQITRAVIERAGKILQRMCADEDVAAGFAAILPLLDEAFGSREAWAGKQVA